MYSKTTTATEGHINNEDKDKVAGTPGTPGSNKDNNNDVGEKSSKSTAGGGTYNDADKQVNLVDVLMYTLFPLLSFPPSTQNSQLTH